ncbi:molybdopterin-dependent oxidoreductase [Anaerobranca gottschalkii]|uniref:Anaerobic selenocysteine-containing dehydrogenase n=1 Tax=Anaerobranca gottschalkii DSM 13577 TaxID=1120990 RepID=A0A1H9YCW7_9FIRM|nr:molybdopterin-dependent oxidoreductase [Anaerobranca gottschalkii]SES66381.1 Anaerobic selenocysteine-containing dehydrogenase [Anaerobranca gottschalkii DSM 13577]
MKTLKSACPLDCWDACSFIVEVKENGDFNVKGDANHPITQGFLCKKGREYLKERVFSSNRIKTPLLKQGESHIPISWEQAISIFAEKIKLTLDNYGPKAIAHYYDSGAGGLLKSLEHRFFNLLGGVTEPIGSLCWAAGLEGTKEDFGTYYCHHPLDMYNSDCIVIWGRNVTETNIHLLPFINEGLKRGKKLVVIDPNETKISEKATLYLKINPATDGFLALALIKKLINLGISQELLKHCNNYDDLVKIVDCYTVEEISEITGIGVNEIDQFAKLYLSGRSTIYLGYGMQRYYNSGNTIRAINSLAYLSGNVGVKGGGVNYADSYVAKNLDINSLTLANSAQPRYFPKPQFAEYLLKEKEPPIKVLYISRANPIVTLPNTNKTLKAFLDIDFVVCCDVVHTDTTKIADLVLPATTSFEEEDLIFTSMWHRYINYVHPVIEPQGQSKPEWMIFQELAKYLDLPNFPQITASQWIEKALKPMEKYNITLEKLKEKSLSPTDQYSLPWQGLKFSTSDGKFNLLNEKILLLEENKDFSYLFMTPHPKLSLHSQFQQHLKLGDYPQIFINPKLAKKEGLKDGDIVIIKSKTGELKGEITLVDWVHRKVLFTYEGRPLSYGNTPNLITDEGLTDIGIGTTMYQTYCKIIKSS